MKKIISLAVFAAFGASAFTAHAAPSHIVRNSDGGYDVAYNYNDKAKTGWYVAGRAEMSFLNFKNEYSGLPDDSVDGRYDNDKYSFESVFGGSLAAGKRIDYFWRAEVEAGYLGYFEDEDAAAKFSISMPYMMINGYYDFTNGLYVGAGLGASLAKYEMSSAPYFLDFKKEKTTFSPMVGLMFGYAHRLDDNLVLDLRYRLAGMSGTELKTPVEVQNYTGESFIANFKSKTGMILDNSISLGIRYEF